MNPARLIPARLIRPIAAAACALPLVAGFAAPPAGARAAAWRPPLERITVAEPFRFDRSRPYVAGQHRVASLAGQAGEKVSAPCAGPVRFAGALPAGGRGVTVGCGRLSATLTGLGPVFVRRDDLLVAGEPVGEVGADGLLGLGARVTTSRHGYRDPVALLGGARRAPPLAPAVRRARPPRPEPRTSQRPAAPRIAAGHRPPVAEALLMGAAWLGIGLAGGALGIGIALRRPSATRLPARRARHAGR